MKNNKRDGSLISDLKADFSTLRSLKGKEKLVFIYDYYRWKILAGIFFLAVIISICDMVWEGHKVYDLHACVVLNTDEDCSDWFNAYADSQTTKEKPFRLDLNQDQPFDYNSSNYQVYEVEVLTKISSQLIDVAICNEDMYSYLLAINACMKLDTVLQEETQKQLKEAGMLIEDIANLQMDENGQIDESQGIPGFYAINLKSGSFAEQFNAGSEEPLYFVIISNTEHTDNCLHLLQAVCE